jgi:hypothetical protein
MTREDAKPSTYDELTDRYVPANSIEFIPPYEAWKNPETGRWFVMNKLGGLEYEADCRDDAERVATELNWEARGGAS